jgi:hypothetical protein
MHFQTTNEIKAIWNCVVIVLIRFSLCMQQFLVFIQNSALGTTRRAPTVKKMRFVGAQRAVPVSNTFHFCIKPKLHVHKTSILCEKNFVIYQRVIKKSSKKTINKLI